jgi:hypothetical protein
MICFNELPNQALSHSHVVADFTEPGAVISRYRLSAYATLLAIPDRHR